MKKLLIGATIALSALLPLGVAFANPADKPDPNPDNGQDCEENGNNGGNNAPHCTTTTVTGPPTTTTQPPGQGDPNPDNGQDCEENGNNGGNNAPHCTTTTVTGPPTTTTQPPGDPCDEDEDEIVDVDNCQTTTTQPPNPCDDEIVDQDNCPTTTTTLPVPLPTTTAPPTATVAPACPGRVRLGNWYADPDQHLPAGQGNVQGDGRHPAVQRPAHDRGHAGLRRETEGASLQGEERSRAEGVQGRQARHQSGAASSQLGGKGGLLLVRLDEPSGPYGSESPLGLRTGGSLRRKLHASQPLAWVLWLLVGEAKYREERPKPQGRDGERPPRLSASCGGRTGDRGGTRSFPLRQSLGGESALRASKPCGRPSRERVTGGR